MATPTHTPPEQVSPCVSGLPSSQGSVFGVCTHPVVGLHESFVHTFWSLQSTVAPDVQFPLTQVPAVAHAFAVLHTTPLATARPTHAPFAHVSPVVQAFPSLQAIVLFVCRQPSTGSQESLVHTLPSPQLIGVPTHVAVPPLHASPVVQTLPSSQGVPVGSIRQADEQQSPLAVLPSSHCSPGSRVPFPQS